MAAFTQQGAMIAASQAAASGGFMPQPATMLSGPLHCHDNLAGNLHVHGGPDEAGHVHGPAGLDHDETDGDDTASVWSIGLAPAVMPAAAYAVLCELVSAAECLPQGRLDGVEPDRLSRPPSTPDIA